MFGIIGLLIKKTPRWLKVVSVIGLILWSVTFFFEYEFIISYSRIAMIVSFFLVMLSGFGMDSLFGVFKSDRKPFNQIIYIFLILILVYFANGYTEKMEWDKIILRSVVNGNEYELLPASPVNLYLAQDDLRVFREIEGKRFLSTPWKGLVIGTVTGNTPLESKSSIISSNTLSYNKFLTMTCDQKMKNARRVNLDYVYLREDLSCPVFEQIDQSGEGFRLYKFVK